MDRKDIDKIQDFDTYWNRVGTELNKNSKDVTFMEMQDKARKLHEKRVSLLAEVSALDDEFETFEEIMQRELIGNLNALDGVDTEDIIINCVEVFREHIYTLYPATLEK